MLTSTTFLIVQGCIGDRPHLHLLKVLWAMLALKTLIFVHRGVLSSSSLRTLKALFIVGNKGDEVGGGSGETLPRGYWEFRRWSLSSESRRIDEKVQETDNTEYLGDIAVLYRMFDRYL